MKLYLVDSENIYFPQIKEYFKEIISSYDNENYRSAMVMLYSTIVCDLMLKLKELSEVYSDGKAEKILAEIDEKRKDANKSLWEWKLIDKIHDETELLTDESYTMIQHIYNLRNFSAHPAITEDYELISPSREITIAYIKKALEDILIKPSIFVSNIVNRMSDDIAAKKDIYSDNYSSFDTYINKVYLDRFSEKMVTQVFKAFWKFTFIKTEELYQKNRRINYYVLKSMLNRFYETICRYITENQSTFSVTQDEKCLVLACLLFAHYPNTYYSLDKNIKIQIARFNEQKIYLIKWYTSKSFEEHIDKLKSKDIRNLRKHHTDFLKTICDFQGYPKLFIDFILDYYSKSSMYTTARDRFDYVIKYYLKFFDLTDFKALLNVINTNKQIYGYSFQKQRNDVILEVLSDIIPSDFNFNDYENFDFTKPQEETEENLEETQDEKDSEFEEYDDLPF